MSVDDDTGADDSMESDDITQLTNDSGPSPVRAERALKNNSESSPDSVENRCVLSKIQLLVIVVCESGL